MKTKIGIALIISLIAFYSVASAQQSYPTKTVDGIEYYVYQVEASEGLYAISKKFGVSQAEINNANPQILDGLKAGQVILIPRNKGRQVAASPQFSDEYEYVLHTVEPKQTIFAISRRYNVSQDAIIQSNPQIKDGLKQGDVLRIPLKKKDVTASAPVYKVTTATPVATQQTLHIGDNETYLTHTVMPKETLYSISKQYNVTIDEIKSMNPETAEALKAGAVLKIPLKGKKTNTSVVAGGNTSTVALPKPKEPKNSYKIAYLLPFMQNNNSIDPTVEKFIEFYLGSLLAVNNAKNGGMVFEIFTYDTEKSETKIYEIINKPEMQKMDMIIGPAYTTQIPILSDFAKRRRINTIIPFSSKVDDIDQNPYIFQFNPDVDFQNEYAVNLFKNRLNDANIVFVETGNNNQTDDGSDFFNYLIKIFNNQRITYKKTGNLEATNMSAILASDRKNILIFDTGDYKSVQNQLSKLYDISSKFDVTVLGQYAWRDLNGKKPKMYYIAPFAGNAKATIFYEQEYQRYYGAMKGSMNPRYDLLGYDLTSYFLSTMKKDGYTFTRSTQSLDFNNGVQSNFRFKRLGKDGGFMNQQLYLIEDEAKRQ